MSRRNSRRAQQRMNRREVQGGLLRELLAPIAPMLRRMERAKQEALARGEKLPSVRCDDL